MLIALARSVGLKGDNLCGLLALIEARHAAERLSHGLLNGEYSATYHGPLDSNGQIAPSAVLDSGHYVFSPSDTWIEARAERPADVPAADWLHWEQEKHERLLEAAALTATP